MKGVKFCCFQEAKRIDVPIVGRRELESTLELDRRSLRC